MLFESCSLSIISNEHWKGEIHTSYRPKHDPCVIIVIILELCGKPKTHNKPKIGNGSQKTIAQRTNLWRHLKLATHLTTNTSKYSLSPQLLVLNNYTPSLTKSPSANMFAFNIKHNIEQSRKQNLKQQ